MLKYRYSRWDGTQELLEPTEDDLMQAMSDDLLAHGDVMRALRRLLQQGMTGPQGHRLPGLRDLLNRLQARRQETLERYNLGSFMEEIQERLDRILDTERRGIERRLEGARGQLEEARAKGEPGEEGAFKALERVADKKREHLDSLPPDPGGRIRGLADYDFMDSDARQQFQELLDMLKQNIMDSHFKDISQGLQGMSPEQMQRMRDMMKGLNQMLRQRMQGQEPDFKGFMDKFGDFFPQNPQDLDQLLDQIQERMNQAQSLLDSLSPQDRQRLQEMMDSLLQGDELRDELMELAANLEMLRPSRQEHGPYPFEGEEPLSYTQALSLMELLQELDQLEKQMEQANLSSDLKNIDVDQLRRLLGEEAEEILERLKSLEELLKEAGYVVQKGNRLELTPKAMRKIGQKALQDIFTLLKKDRFGKHPIDRGGSGSDRSDDTRIYEFGMPFHLHLEQTLMNALRREGAGHPVHLDPQDFQVYETEQLTQCSTVLMLDLSWSMPLRGKFLAAKKVALALESLIRTQFPRDNLYLVGFSDYARELKSDFLPQITWNDYYYGTNMQHGFMLSRKLLARHKSGTRQIIMITDGEPTAHIEGGRSYFEYPPNPRTLQLTLLEAKRCAREGIVINTFMLEKSYHLMQFVDHLARISRGRVFYTSPESLGQYLLVDYLANKRRRAA